MRRSSTIPSALRSAALGAFRRVDALAVTAEQLDAIPMLERTADHELVCARVRRDREFLESAILGIIRCWRAGVFSTWKASAMLRAAAIGRSILLRGNR